MPTHNAQGGSPAIDTRVEVVTPENIAFDYQVAGPFVRFPAYLIDVVIRLMFLFAVGMALGVTSAITGVADGVLLVVYFVLDWFYGALFEALWNGQTPGKRLMQIRVVGVDGQPIAAWQAVLRNFLRFVDAQPAVGPIGFFALGLVSTAANRRFQRLGDLAARTMVVVEQPAKLYGLAPITEYHILAVAERLPRKLQIDRSLARVLSDYVLRRRRLHPMRRNEIAMHVGEPLRKTFGLPSPIDYDVLLCAVYHRLYFGGVETPLPPVAPTIGWSPPGPSAVAPGALNWAPQQPTNGGWR